jgi:pimeloyl-ACP methyl ester carboxylesterase
VFGIGTRARLPAGHGAFARALALLGGGLALAACGGGSPASVSPPAASTSSFTEVAVAFSSPGAAAGAATLCGTLALPASPAPGRPGVVLLHGSGPNDRDQPLPATLMHDARFDSLDGALDGLLRLNPPLAVFRGLAQHLASRGYAVLRYDKRSWLAVNGSSCGPRPAVDAFTVTADDFLADAEAAVAALKTRAEVDATRVFVVGHSEGALFALVLAARPGRVRGAVSLAGPARPIDTVVLEQVRGALAYQRSLPPTPERARQVEETARVLLELEMGFEQLRRGRFPPDRILLGAGAAFWTSLIALTDSTEGVVRQATVPRLFTGGELDFNVPASDLDLFQAWSAPTGRVVRLPGVTHALNAVTTTGSGTTVSPDLLAALEGWLAGPGSGSGASDD